MIFIKLHKSYRTVVAVCDSDLIGKKFEENFEKGTKQLEIKEHFFKGEEKTYEEAVQILKFQKREDATFNIVGKESIKAAIEANLITEQNVQTIQGIPYALVLL